jgi:hypothetical protein
VKGPHNSSWKEPAEGALLHHFVSQAEHGCRHTDASQQPRQRMLNTIDPPTPHRTHRLKHATEKMWLLRKSLHDRMRPTLTPHAPCPGHPRVGASVVDAVLHTNCVRKIQLKVKRRIHLVVDVHAYSRVRVGVVWSTRAAKQREPLLCDDVRMRVARGWRLRELKQNLHMHSVSCCMHKAV